MSNGLWLLRSLETAEECANRRLSRWVDEKKAAEAEAGRISRLRRKLTAIADGWRQRTLAPGEIFQRWSFRKDGQPCWAADFLTDEQLDEARAAEANIVPLKEVEKMRCPKCFGDGYRLHHEHDVSLVPGACSCHFFGSMVLCTLCVNVFNAPNTPDNCSGCT